MVVFATDFRGVSLFKPKRDPVLVEEVLGELPDLEAEDAAGLRLARRVSELPARGRG
jgi:hypothetical protein